MGYYVYLFVAIGMLHFLCGLVSVIILAIGDRLSNDKASLGLDMEDVFLHGIVGLPIIMGISFAVFTERYFPINSKNSVIQSIYNFFRRKSD